MFTIPQLRAVARNDNRLWVRQEFRWDSRKSPKFHVIYSIVLLNDAAGGSTSLVARVPSPDECAMRQSFGRLLRSAGRTLDSAGTTLQDGLGPVERCESNPRTGVVQLLILAQWLHLPA